MDASDSSWQSSDTSAGSLCIRELLSEIAELKLKVAEKESSVPLTDYKLLLRKLEEEQISHSQTRTALRDIESQLDFALGEIMILKSKSKTEKNTSMKQYKVLQRRALSAARKTSFLQDKVKSAERTIDLHQDIILKEHDKVHLLQNKLKDKKKELDHVVSEIELEKEQAKYLSQIATPKKCKTDR